MIKFALSQCLLILCCSIMSNVTWADQCTLGVSNVYQSIQQKQISKSGTLSQLIQQLGAPQQSKPYVTNSFYQWKSFVMWNSSTGASSAYGTFPGSVDPKSLSLGEALKTLGQPINQKIIQQTQYDWHCTNGSTLSAIALPDGSLMSVKINQCVGRAQNCQSLDMKLKEKDDSQLLFDKVAAENPG